MKKTSAGGTARLRGIAVLIVVSVLTGCGGGDGKDSDYCKDLQAAQPKIAGLQSNGAAGLPDAFKASHQLAAEAPDEVKDDWAVLDGGMRTFEKKLKEIGITPKDLVELDRGKLPEGVKVEDLQGLPAAYQELAGPRAVKASANIRKHAKEVCELDLQI
jgi:hypothetical protein